MFSTRKQLHAFAGATWTSLSVDDKRLLCCYDQLFEARQQRVAGTSAQLPMDSSFIAPEPPFDFTAP